MSVATTTKLAPGPSRAGRRPPSRPGWAPCRSSPTPGCSCSADRHPGRGRVQEPQRGLALRQPVSAVAARSCAATSSARSSCVCCPSVAGAVLGRCWRMRWPSGNPDGVVRRLAIAGSGVLAQFGGVTLAFAFLALDRPGRAAVSRQLVLRLPVGHRADLHLLPDPADGAGLPARDRRAEGPVAGGVGEPGLLRLAVLAVCGRPVARPGLPGRGAAAVRQRAVRLRDDRGVGEPDRLRRAAADQHRPVQRGRAGQRQRGRPARAGHDRHGGGRHDRYALLQRRAARWLR